MKSILTKISITVLAVFSIFMLQPPERFTHYSRPVIIHRLQLFDALSLCVKRVGPAWACQWFTPDGDCHIAVPTDSPFGSVEQYIRHERAHCAGWSNWHEGGS